MTSKRLHARLIADGSLPHFVSSVSTCTEIANGHLTRRGTVSLSPRLVEAFVYGHRCLRRPSPVNIDLEWVVRISTWPALYRICQQSRCPRLKCIVYFVLDEVDAPLASVHEGFANLLIPDIP